MIEVHLSEPEPPDPHDHHHPDDGKNFQRAVDLLLRNPGCPTCGEVFTLVAGPGPEWVLDHVHHPGCPEDAEPEAYEVNVGDDYDPEVHRTAEAIWEDSNPVEEP